MNPDTFGKKRVCIIGSTGSIGANTCSVIRDLKDRFEVVALSACRNAELLVRQAEEFRPLAVAVADEASAATVSSRLEGLGIRVLPGVDGLREIARMDEADVVVSSIVGAAGLLPTVEAVKAGKTVALANKEVLVTAGEIVMKLAQENGATIIPVDSEHSALFQCLNGEELSSVKRLILTASGGPFLNHRGKGLDDVSPGQALDHPRWNMGNKITIDSATLMNKGFEVMEAHWLFGIDVSRVDVVIHPQSIIHSMVEFVDGAILAQMGEPDMRIPIQYALTYPERLHRNSAPFDFLKNSSLTFAQPDRERFPCLDMAYEALRTGGTMPCVLNAANEMAVERFLKNEIRFTDIPKYIRSAMDSHRVISDPGIEDILAVDGEIRKEIFA